MTEKLYPSDEIHVKKEFSPYVTTTETIEGHQTHINIPNRYDIKLNVHNLIPGICVILDHSNLKDYNTSSDDILYYEHPEDNLLINFLYKGQCKLKVDEDKYMFIKEKDINLYIKKFNPESFSYVGEVTIIHLIINKKQFKKPKKGYNKEFDEIVDELFRAAEKENITVLKSPDIIIKTIEEYNNLGIKKDKCDRLFFQLKTLESLLLLYEHGITDEKTNQRTYSDATIRVVRNIKNSLSRNIAGYVSLDRLAISYGINLTTLKNCFKDMYGKPLYTWYKEYKFYRAKELIKNTNYPISQIAHMVGYKSSSKFTKAFKKEMGVLPSSLRKTKK
jgi:AraC-like DNA-binding protein